MKIKKLSSSGMDTSGASSRSPIKRGLMIVVPLLFVATLAGAFLLGKGAGKDEPKEPASVATPLAGSGTGSGIARQQKNDLAASKDFTIEGDADRYVGGYPLKVHFTVKSTHAKGKVTYEWDFDEGDAKATGTNPTYTFTKPGWKLPKVKGTDEAGHVYNHWFQMRVWPPETYKALTSGKLSLERQTAITIANMRALERKTHSKIPGISAPPLKGQQPLTLESALAAKQRDKRVRELAEEALRKQEEAQKKKSGSGK